MHLPGEVLQVSHPSREVEERISSPPHPTHICRNSGYCPRNAPLGQACDEMKVAELKFRSGAEAQWAGALLALSSVRKV